MIRSYKELVVWQKSRLLVKEVYVLTNLFPKSELYGLTSQIRRCCISIPSNIAGGFQRQSRKEYLQFLYIAYGSSAELETQLILGNDLRYITDFDLEKLGLKLTEIQKMLNSLISKLKS